MIGEVIKSTDLQSVECVVKLFDRSRWRIICGVAKKFTVYFEKGKPIEVYYDELPVEKVYPEIRLLFDKRDRVVAQRSGTKAPLRVSVQGNWRARVKVNNHLKSRNVNLETTKKVYNHLESLKIVN